MPRKRILSIVLIVSMLICGTYFAEEAFGSANNNTEQTPTELCRSSNFVVLNAYYPEKLATKQSAVKTSVLRSRPIRNIVLNLSFDGSQVQFLSACAFVEKRISSTETFSHKILLDYIHMQDGEYRLFI